MPHALIVGASGGIGSAVVAELRHRGWQLHLAARDRERLEALAEGEEVVAPCDATDRGALSATVEAAADAAGDEPLGLVLAVGSILLKPAHRTDAGEFADTIARNLTTAFNLVAAAGASCRKGGSAVLFSSAAARIGLMNHEAIAAAKAGVEGLVRSAAATYAGRGLRINALAPGLVETPLSAAITGSAAARAASEKLHPLGRLGRPADIAPIVADLLDPGTAWITGQVIGVDGGLATCRAA